MQVEFTSEIAQGRLGLKRQKLTKQGNNMN